MTTRLQRTAYHEAGHAVASIELGRAFRYVTIEPDESRGSLGHVLSCRLPDSFNPEFALTARDHRLLEAEVVILLSGIAAEAAFCGRNNWMGSCDDFHQAVDLASYVHFDSDLCGKYVDYLQMRARKLIQIPAVWAKVEAVAAALLQHERIGYRRARQICRQVDEDAFEKAMAKLKRRRSPQAR